MHKHLVIFIGIITLLSVFTQNILSQVTIGSKAIPIKAGILDIKSKEAVATNAEKVTDNKNITSDKGGLVLPRVKLQNIQTLEPFIDNTAPQLNDLKVKHVGMLVYNLNNTDENETNPMKVFKEGIYMWDGSRWSMLVREEFKFFHMPTFNLDISQVGKREVDLYAEYIKQFTRKDTSIPADYPSLIKNPSAVFETVPVYKRNEINYYVTYGDDSIVKDVEVNDSGIMVYTVNPTTPITPISYMNIVFVIK